MITPQVSQALAELLDAIGGPSFGAKLDQLVGCGTMFDMSRIFAFSSSRDPVLIHDGYSASLEKRVLRAYLRGGYLLDPFYSACVSGRPEGLWRMRDLAPDEFYMSDFMASREVHPCISDQAGSLVEEVGFLIRLDDDFTAIYSLMRNQGRSPFSDAELDTIAAVRSIIASSLRQHWRSLPAANRAEMPSRADADLVFQHVFGDVLTPTQHAVTKLILRGHSSLSIADHLQIVEGTVKIHRSNIYRRLNISSQSELFQMFIAHLVE